MGDFKTSTFMYLLGLAIVAFVIAESLFFLIRAYRRGRQLGMSKEKLRTTITSSAVFTIAPALAIVATVLTLAGALGIVLPWIRLSVIGAIQYEVPAAKAAIEAAGGVGGLTQEVTSPEAFSAAAWVMTLGSVLPLVLVPFLLKKIQKSVGKVVSKDTKWGDTMAAAAFIGLISAFIGRAILGSGEPDVIGDGAGVMSITALVSSMIFMFILQWLCKKFSLRKLEPFAMPLSMFMAMGVVMLASAVLPDQIAFIEWRG